MKHLFCVFSLLLCCIVYSQELVIKKDIVYGKADDLHNKTVTLKLDIVCPSKGGTLPLIIYAHGGGFMESSTKESHLKFCEQLAMKGFVVANIEYRRGFDMSPENFKTKISKAVYRSVQDQLAAARYLVHHSAEYFIDTSWVFFAGESAGGVTSLFSAYVTQDEWDQSAPQLSESLGTINNSGNGLNDKFRIKGVISMWGGLADTAFISNRDALVPVLLFHSTDDKEIPFERNSLSGAKQQLLFGSRDIANRFKNINGCYEFYFIRGAGHAYGFSSDYVTTAISSFISNIRKSRCHSLETENKSRNISLSIFDPEEAAFADEDSKIIRIDPKILQQYAGKYESSGIIVIVMVEGDHLIARAGGESNELYPVSDNIFIQKKYNVRVEFVKDTEGKVTEHILRLTRYKEFHYRKTE
jgi:acetyl esterase/lipase